MKKLLIIGNVWPEPNSSAAGGRMMQLIERFLQAQWDICFACPAAESEYSFPLIEKGIRKETIALNDHSFDLFIAELQPHAVLFDRFMMEEQFGWRVAHNCPDALRILDTEDLHCLRLSRQLAVKEHREMTEADLKSDTARREIASIFRCDLSIMISSHEMNLLEQTFHIDPALLQYLPIVVGEFPDVVKPFEERNDFVTIGNFRHPPNADAVRYLQSDIWPLIRKALPNARMHVYGSYPTPALLQLHHPASGFLVHGRAESALEVMGAARVCLAPLRFGAGIKGKLLEAMLCGTPSVTTMIGAEGMQGDLPWNGYVRDNSIAFAEAAVRLYTSQTEWENAVEHGHALLKKHFNTPEFGDSLMRRVDELLLALPQHRLANFTGAMLMHHTLQSTKYLSRWIEEKNKNGGGSV